MRKSILIFLFALLGILSARAGDINPNYDFEVDGIYYNIISGTDHVEVTYKEWRKDNYSGSVVIPSTVTYRGTTYAVTSIGEGAFFECSSSLTSVTIPESVTTIGDYAFDRCSGLTSMTIPNSVTSIGYGAFQGCSGLTSVTIPNSVTYIGDYAFTRCSGLTSVTIPNSVTYIGDDAFSETSISNPLYNSKVFAYLPPNYSGVYSIPSGIQAIAGGAFHRCTGLTSVTIPESVTSIGNEAFAYCTGLTSVTIPESVTSIGVRAFKGCTSISSPLYNSKVFAYMPEDYSGEYAIPSGIQAIAGSAFSGCGGLTEVTIPNSVTYIGEYAFFDCSGLTEVAIPESVDTIGNYPFSYCTSISSPLYNSKIFAKLPADYTGGYAIPSGIQSIAGGAFVDCSGLTSVTIPESVTSIGEGAFYGCSGLTSVTIPESVTFIGVLAFEDCTGLTSVTIPESVTSIRGAFWYCTGLTSVEWNVVACQDFNDDYESPFHGCENIVSITFGERVEHIPAYLCFGWYNLTSVTIPNSVTSIGSYAFYDCSSLTSVTIPNSLTSIGDRAFYECSGLTSVTIPNSVTSIGTSAFNRCTGLISITLSKSLNTIGQYAFSGCDKLLSVTSLSKTPPYCVSDGDDYVFSFYEGTLLVPRGCKIAYQTAPEWYKFSKIEELAGAGTATVTVKSNDASMGTVIGGGVCELDEQVTLAAIPNSGYRFVKWDDGVTANPRTLTVTGDITLTAIFAKNTPNNPDIPDTPTANENSEEDNFRVYVQDRTIYLSEDRGSVQVYNMAGQCVYNGHATAIPVPQSGVYILVAGSRRCKVLVR